MHTATDCYFGTYKRFETASKKEAAVLLGADNIVGDFFTVEFELMEDEAHKKEQRAYIVNKFGRRIGFFDKTFSQDLYVYKVKKWHIVCLLSFVAFTESPEPGFYWGEVAVIAYDANNNEYQDAFSTFTQEVAKRIAQDLRPDVTLSASGIQELLKNKGAWMPDKKHSLPKKTVGTAIVKSRQTFNEKLIEQGRKKNIGCYIISWVFLLAVVAFIVLSFKACFAG